METLRSTEIALIERYAEILRMACHTVEISVESCAEMKGILMNGAQSILNFKKAF